MQVVLPNNTQRISLQDIKKVFLANSLSVMKKIMLRERSSDCKTVT
jgi:hypothetical protein